MGFTQETVSFNLHLLDLCFKTVPQSNNSFSNHRLSPWTVGKQLDVADWKKGEYLALCLHPSAKADGLWDL